VEALYRLADRLEEAAATLAGTRAEECATGTGDGQEPGAPGEVAGALRRQLSAALHARTEEAVAAGTRMGALAADLRLAAAGYLRADRAAASRTAGLELP
jgi:hypothetical protein